LNRGKEQVWKQFWVAVRRRIEDLVESSGTRLRLGGLNNTRSICAIYELPEHIWAQFSSACSSCALLVFGCFFVMRGRITSMCCLWSGIWCWHLFHLYHSDVLSRCGVSDVVRGNGLRWEECWLFHS